MHSRSSGHLITPELSERMMRVTCALTCGRCAIASTIGQFPVLELRVTCQAVMITML